MIYKTYLDLKTKIKNDLDLTSELFITDSELLGYCNSGIDEAESEIHTLYEDYFLTESSIDLVVGQSTYELPTNIYAMKIREIVFDDGSTIYPVRRMMGRNRLELQQLTNQYTTTDWYQYYIVNNAASSISDTPNLILVPSSRITLSGALKIHYLRNANEMVDDTSVCDIPEFYYFVLQYIKVRCYEKEGHPNLESAKVDLEKYRMQMRDTLSHMIPDGENLVPIDLTFYNESS